MKTLTPEQLKFKRALKKSIVYLEENYSDNENYVPTMYYFENGGYLFRTELASNCHCYGQITKIDEWGDCTGEVVSIQFEQYWRPTILRTDNTLPYLDRLHLSMKDIIDERNYQEQE